MKASPPLKFEERMRTRQRSVSKGLKKIKQYASSFDKESLLRAKEKLLTLKSCNLFYIHLEIDRFQNLLEEYKDDLLHWQYVFKKEKFLIQLPVDFDLLTYK